MCELKLFENENFGNVRVVVRDGEPWFVAKDVCDCLGLDNVSKACERLDDDEVSSFTKSDVGENTGLYDFSNGGRAPLIVSESGLYTLIMRSNKLEAKPFKRWVTHEVLPSIRKHGSYSAEPSNDQSEKLEKYQKIVDELIELLTYERKQKELAVDHSYRMLKENEQLREQIEQSYEYRRMREIPWIRKYFDTSIKGIWLKIGNVLTSISKIMELEVKVVDDDKWGTVNAYNVRAIHKFREVLDRDKSILVSYRR